MQSTLCNKKEQCTVISSLKRIKKPCIIRVYVANKCTKIVPQPNRNIMNFYELLFGLYSFVCLALSIKGKGVVSYFNAQ